MSRTIRFIPHENIDFDKWDACVDAVQFPQPYGFSWYLNWLSNSWQAVVLGDYEVVLPIFQKKKYGVTFSTRPFGTQSLGPYAKIPLTEDILQGLIEEAMKHVQYAELFFGNHAATAPLSGKEYSNLVLDTTPDYKELAANYSNQTKRNLKKAQKAKFELAEWVTINDAVQLWNQEMSAKSGIQPQSMERLGRLLEFCNYQKRGVLYAVRDEYNQLCGAQFWVVFQGRSTLILNASTDWGKENGVSSWLIDSHIKSVSGRKHVVDFEGSSIEGLYRFYSGFGATDQPFTLHIENHLPLPIRWFKPATTR